MGIYIKSLESISPQNTFDTDSFFEEIIQLEHEYYSCLKPSYKDYINPKLLRRMSTIVRNGVIASKLCLQKAKVDNPDAIIIGTSLGCIEDTTKFLNQLIENKEQLLNPTAFIQSTHNTVSGKIALLIGCHNYNLTYSQRTTSFESALVDAQLLFWDNKAKNILVGGIDEITKESFYLLNKVSCAENVIHGEGATFFVLSNIKDNANSIKFKGIEIVNNTQIDFTELLDKYGLKITDIDLVIGGDKIENDRVYDFVKGMFSKSSYAMFKHLTGDYDTASSFGMWLGTKIISNNIIPEKLVVADSKRDEIKNVLVYNTNGKEHALILLSV